MHRLITTTNELHDICARFSGNAFVCVDTEFIREKTYYPRLCLVQIAAGAEAYAIDPLAESIDLSSLYALMSKPEVTKVFHAAKQDIEIFYQRMGSIPTPLYDTQVAAMVCGFGEQVGYESLVNKMLGKELDKASRFTDWAQRPLTQRQIDYALDDVIYLGDIYTQLREYISEKSRDSWIEEEMRHVQSEQTYRVDPLLSWKRLKYKNRKPAYLNILRSIAAWRERTAQLKDIPRGRLMKDEVVLQIAAMNPTNLDELAQVRGAMRHLSADNARLMLEEMAKAREIDPADYPKDHKRKPFLSSGQEVVLDILKLLLKLECDKAGVASKLVAGKDDLAAYLMDPASPDIPFMKGWRYELFGQLAERFIAGKLSLQAIKGGEEILFLETE